MKKWTRFHYCISLNENSIDVVYDKIGMKVYKTQTICSTLDDLCPMLLSYALTYPTRSIQLVDFPSLDIILDFTERRDLGPVDIYCGDGLTSDMFKGKRPVHVASVHAMGAIDCAVLRLLNPGKMVFLRGCILRNPQSIPNLRILEHRMLPGFAIENEFISMQPHLAVVRAQNQDSFAWYSRILQPAHPIRIVTITGSFVDAACIDALRLSSVEYFKVYAQDDCDLNRENGRQSIHALVDSSTPLKYFSLFGPVFGVEFIKSLVLCPNIMRFEHISMDMPSGRHLDSVVETMQIMALMRDAKTGPFSRLHDMLLIQLGVHYMPAFDVDAEYSEIDRIKWDVEYGTPLTRAKKMRAIVDVEHCEPLAPSSPAAKKMRALV